MLKGERQLWCAVIAQAIEDATAPLSENIRRRKEQVRAREWFTIACEDFQRACDLAGYDPERIRVATVGLIDAVKHRDPKPRQQQPRLRTNVLHHYEGRSLTIQEWAAETGLNKHIFYAGIKRGKSIGRIINGRGRAAIAESLPDRQSPSTQDIT